MNLWRVPIDEASGKVLGPARPERLPAREVGGFAISRDGRVVVYVDRETTYAIDRLTFDAEARLIGKPEEIYESSQEMADFDVSFDGEAVRVRFARGRAGRHLRPRIRRNGAAAAHGRRLPRPASGVLPRRQAARVSLRPQRPVRHLDDRDRRQRPGADDEIDRRHDHRAPLVSGRQARGDQQRKGVLRRHARREGRSPRKCRRSPSRDQQTFFLPLAWSGDGQHLLGAISRLPDRQTIGLGFYSPETNTLSEPFRGITTAGNARRGSFLGNRAIHLDIDGIHVADLAAGTERVVVPNTDVGRYNYVMCRSATTCYVVRASDNADIWQRAEGAPAR